MNWRDRITATPDVLVGKPRIKDTRISVELIMERLGAGWTVETILESYPRITREDVMAACQFTAELLGEEQQIAAKKVAA